MKHSKAPIAMDKCRAETSQLVALMANGGRLDEASERLAVATGGPQVSGRISVKFSWRW